MDRKHDARLDLGACSDISETERLSRLLSLIVNSTYSMPEKKKSRSGEKPYDNTDTIVYA